MADSGASRVFLDAAGSAPLSERARQAFHAAIDDGWADPARLHAESRAARALVDGARESIAAELGASPALTRFTHSPFTALALPIDGVARARRGTTRVVTSAVDRVAVLSAADGAAADGVESVGVDADGRIDPEAWGGAVGGEAVALATLQHANRETGAIQDVEALYESARRAGVPVCVDATASVGHVPLPAAWDALSAHPADWGGPGGLGVVALRPHTRWLPARPSNNPWAPGGVNVAAALAAAVALKERASARAELAPRLARLTREFAAAAAAAPGVRAVTVREPSLPHVLTLVCDGVDGEAVQAELDRRGFAVGSGSACTAGDFPRSHVLEAMGIATVGNVRLGLHPGVADDAPAAFAAALTEALAAVRG